MNLIAALLAPFLLGAAALGCNTAQVTQPAQIDAGPPCSEKPPLEVSCAVTEAGVGPGACTGSVVVTAAGLDAASTVPAGGYPVGCTLTFFVDDHAGGCLDSPTCTCVVADSEAGADAAVLPGVWSCKR